MPVQLACAQDTETASRDTGTAVRSVDRALMVLEALASASSPHHLADLADATRLPKATVHRLLNALAARGFATRADEGYMLGSRLFLLAADAKQADRLQRLYMPFLLEVHVRTRAAVSVGLLNGSHVVYSGSVHGYEGTPRSRDAVPAHCSALGKLLLAYQPGAVRVLGEELPRLTGNTVATMAQLRLQLIDIRRRGVAIAHEERIRGEVEVAVPVFARSKEVVTGLSVAGAEGRLDVESAVMHLTRIATRASAHCP